MAELPDVVQCEIWTEGLAGVGFGEIGRHANVAAIATANATR